MSSSGRRGFLVVPGLLALLCATLPARGDLLYLSDGRILEVPAMERTADGVLIHYRTAPVPVPQAMILEAVIEGDATFRPTTEEERLKYEQGLVPFEGRWMPAARRVELVSRRLAERKAALQKEQEYREWRSRRTASTKHFEFEYTVPQHVFERFRDLMEAYFTVFSRDWSVSAPRELGKLKTCFYIDQEAYHQISGAPYGAIAYFKFVQPMELNFYYDSSDLGFTEDVMFHEANHYLTKLIDVDFKYPHFPGESLAEYYGASDFDPATGQIKTGLVQEGRLTEIQTDLASGKKMSLEELVKTDGMYEHYTWGWSLVHFLMNDKDLRKRFQKFVLGLARDKGVRREPYSYGLNTVSGEGVLEAFRDFLGVRKPEDWKALESRWHAYVEGQLKPPSPPPAPTRCGGCAPCACSGRRLPRAAPIRSPTTSWPSCCWRKHPPQRRSRRRSGCGAAPWSWTR